MRTDLIRVLRMRRAYFLQTIMRLVARNAKYSLN